jgi:DnaK suppressor protein
MDIPAQAPSRPAPGRVDTVPALDPERAKELIATERAQVEADLAAARRGGPEESDDHREPGDYDSEGLYQDELDAGLVEDLKRRLEAVERAEERLAAGTYGLSVRSGEPIPDARLEANPTAELTVEEAERGGR